MDWLVSADGRVAIAVLAGLVLFSWTYDRWVSRLEREGKERGYLSLIVALGFAVTLGGFALWTGEWLAAGQILLCCVASGSFMIVGSIRRYQDQRAREEAQSRIEAEEIIRHASS